MSSVESYLFDIEGLAHLDDERVEKWIEQAFPLEGRREAWNRVCSDWLDQLAEQLPGNYRGIESDHFFLVADLDLGQRDRLIQLAERAWKSLREILGSAARLSSPGRQVIIAFNNRKTMFQYAAPYYPEGKLAAFVGLFLRRPCPLILMQDGLGATSTLVHELLHAAVSHLALPQWVEEGLAQTFEVDHGATAEFLLTPEDARTCRSFWRKRGLKRFWSGEGFHRAGQSSTESYRLAQILARLLLDDAKPGWWGFGQARRQRFIRFLENAKAVDAGEAAAREALGFGIVDLAERFLGAPLTTTRSEVEETTSDNG